jgi:hypothetical protein
MGQLCMMTTQAKEITAGEAREVQKLVSKNGRVFPSFS